VTGIVIVASRSKLDETAAAASATKESPRTAAQVTARPRVPEQVVVKACNDQAAVATGPRDKTVEVVKERRRRRVARRGGRRPREVRSRMVARGQEKARPSAVSWAPVPGACTA